MDYGFVLWAPTLLAMVLKVPAMRAAKLFMAIAFTSMIAKFVWAFLSEIIGRRVGGMLIGIGAASLRLIISRFWNVWIGSVPVIYVSFIAVYCFTNGGWSITGPYSAEVWPQRLRGTGMGAAWGFGGVGRIFGPMVLAFFAGSKNLILPKATTSAIGPAYIFFACCGLMLAVTYYFARETRNKSVAEIEAMLTTENNRRAKGAVVGR